MDSTMKSILQKKLILRSQIFSRIFRDSYYTVWTGPLVPKTVVLKHKDWPYTLFTRTLTHNFVGVPNLSRECINSINLLERIRNFMKIFSAFQYYLKNKRLEE